MVKTQIEQLLESMIKHVETKRDNARITLGINGDFDLDLSDDASVSEVQRDLIMKTPSKQIKNLTHILSHLYEIDLSSEDELKTITVYEIEPRLNGKYNIIAVSPTFPGYSKTIENNSYFTVTRKSPIGNKLLELDVGDIFLTNNSTTEYTIKSIK